MAMAENIHPRNFSPLLLRLVVNIPATKAETPVQKDVKIVKGLPAAAKPPIRAARKPR